MKKFGKFLLENIAGVAAAVAFAVVVWAFTKFNIYILIGGFVAGYFVIGWIVEFLMMTFAKAVVKKAPEEETVKPDLRSGLKYAAARRVDIVTDFEGIEGGDDDAEKEPVIDARPEKKAKKKQEKQTEKQTEEPAEKPDAGSATGSNSEEPGVKPAGEEPEDKTVEIPENKEKNDDAGEPADNNENGESDAGEQEEEVPEEQAAVRENKQEDDPDGEPYDIPDDDVPDDFGVEEETVTEEDTLTEEDAAVEENAGGEEKSKPSADEE
ncbi:MAG: hypothetical protein II739_01880 [Clostridia bacterium]|nr:hypothetical protein [Clostridia bacterium]